MYSSDEQLQEKPCTTIIKESRAQRQQQQQQSPRFEIKSSDVQNEQLKVQNVMQMEFINIAAHELRTPIQPILGLSEVLISKVKDTEHSINDFR